MGAFYSGSRFSLTPFNFVVTMSAMVVDVVALLHAKLRKQF